MVSIEICADQSRPEICSNCDAKKVDSDPLYFNCIFSYSDIIDFSIPVGGITDV